MNKLIVAIVALVVGGVIGYIALPKSIGAVSYDKQYFQDVNIAKTLNVEGAATFPGGASITGWTASTLGSQTVGALIATSTAVVKALNASTTVIQGTASVAGIATMATSSMTSLCVKNAEGIWTKITFAGVTPSYATSTNCI